MKKKVKVMMILYIIIFLSLRNNKLNAQYNQMEISSIFKLTTLYIIK